jgi:hypothetical protein
MKVDYPRGDDEPVEGLDPDYLTLDVIDTPPPAYDPQAEYLEEVWVADVATLEYRREWTTHTKPPAPPEEEWDEFNATLLADPLYHQAVGLCNQNLPGAAPAPAIALTQVKTNGVAAFALAFTPFCTYGQVAQETRDEWGDLAELHNLPSDFVAVLRGS